MATSDDLPTNSRRSCAARTTRTTDQPATRQSDPWENWATNSAPAGDSASGGINQWVVCWVTVSVVASNPTRHASAFVRFGETLDMSTHSSPISSSMGKPASTSPIAVPGKRLSSARSPECAPHSDNATKTQAAISCRATGNPHTTSPARIATKAARQVRRSDFRTAHPRLPHRASSRASEHRASCSRVRSRRRKHRRAPTPTRTTAARSQPQSVEVGEADGKHHRRHHLDVAAVKPLVGPQNAGDEPARDRKDSQAEQQHRPADGRCSPSRTTPQTAIPVPAITR